MLMSPTPPANDCTHEIGHKQETQPTQSQQILSFLVLHIVKLVKYGDT